MANERKLVGLWAGVVAIVWGVANVRAFTESDVFWHLSLGREIVRHHARTFPETTSFVAAGQTSRSQEWLWDVGTYALHARFGWTAISILVIVLAACAGAACCAAAWTFRAAEPGERLGSFFVTTALISAPVLARIRERPETAALVLLPLMLVAARQLALTRASKPAVRAALAVVGIQLLWAQLHPSFVLGPVVIAILAGPELVLGPDRRRVAIVLGGFVVAFLSNLPALAAFGGHLGGYAVRNVTDMAPPPWTYLDPSASPLLPSYAAIGLFALVAMASARRVFVRPLLLALVGAAIAFRAWRGIGPGAVLAIPLAMESFGELLRRTRAASPARAALAGLALAVLLLVRAVQWFDGEEGGLGFTGLNPGAYPLAAASVLSQHAAPGTRVLTSYASGASLGFLLDGRVRTFVDSRTPLLFDDVEYGEARAIWYREGTIAAATQRYGVDAAVVERDLALCTQLAADPTWVVVAVDPQFTTFARSGPLTAIHAILTLEPCAATSFLKADACEAPALLASDLDAVGQRGSSGFANYLRALRVTQCSAHAFDADAVVALLSPRSAALGFLAHRDGLLAWVYASGKRDDQVRAIARPYLDGPWGATNVNAMLPALHALPATESSADLFELAYADKLEAAPAWLEAKLAAAAIARGDANGAALHGLRAAALGAEGEPETGSSLCWLTKQSDGRVRDDASAWLEVLRKRATTAQTREALVCR